MPEPLPPPDTARENRRGRDAGPEATREHISAPPSALTPVPVALPDAPGDTPGAAPGEPRAVGSAGRNLLFGEIARGGMGAVLRGRDPALGRELAVKVLLEEHRNNAELVGRFLEEAQIAGQLQHPGVVPVYELGRFDDNRPFFTMKLVKGQTLALLLEQRADPRDNLPRFLTIFEQLCQTVAYAHARRVIHRDLKPSNVMVGSFGEVQVMDWGLAKVLSPGGTPAEATRPAPEVTNIRTVPAASTAEGQRAGTLFGLGTFGYMPPEQALGEADQIDERADVFALGAILCVILSGQRPYVGTADEVRRQTSRGDLAAAYARLDASGMDPELVCLAKSCLAARREDRPGDAGKVAAAVTVHLAGVAERLRVAELARAAAQARAAEEAQARVLAEQIADAERAKVRHERRARRLTVALAASLILLMLLGGSGGLWLKHQADARAAERADRAARTVQRVERALLEADAYHRQARQLTGDPTRWRSALRNARQAATEAERLAADETAPHELAGRVTALLAELAEDEKDLELVRRLEQARAAGHRIKDGRRDIPAAAVAFEQVFREYGLDFEKLSAGEAADRIGKRPIADELLLALNDWGLARFVSAGGQDPLFQWTTAVVSRADPEFLASYREVVETHEALVLSNLPPVYMAPSDDEFASRTRLQRRGLVIAYRQTGR
jgi:serine/threonine-protein kinase